MSDDDRRDIVDALMAHAYDFAHLHHGRIRMDANAAGLVADIVLGYMHDVTTERDRLRAVVDAREDERNRLRDTLSAERRINAESGCPDCGVHAGCYDVVAERDRLRAAIKALRHRMVSHINGCFCDAHDGDTPGVNCGWCAWVTTLVGDIDRLDAKEGT